jgi:hypothetical protein
MAGVHPNEVAWTRDLIEVARSRGENLPYGRARQGARGLEILKRYRVKLTELGRLRELPATLPTAARWVCEILYEVKGVDPAPYLRELKRLDALYGQDVVRRCREARGPTSCSGRSPVDRIWIQKNGIC